ncbi:DUF397 domain-containing protein [Nocardia niigatensis]|uniref:DUF397 domain-containing protein n=1 Tax=Nocardia niigatensis TaxID=209249 RepID=UPI0003176F62|nr:DUF397 domain-containing protein [Nocardia niigatensis]
MKKPAMSEWYKSSFSDAGKECVEVRHDPAVTLVRDTKDNGRGPILAFPADVWTDFIDSRIWQR